jgi:hypothetical protein
MVQFFSVPVQKKNYPPSLFFRDGKKTMIRDLGLTSRIHNTGQDSRVPPCCYNKFNKCKGIMHIHI